MTARLSPSTVVRETVRLAQDVIFTRYLHNTTYCKLQTPTLPIASPLHLFVLDNLNPIAIRIQHKRNVLHPPVRESLFPIDSFFFETLAGCVDVIDRNAYVAETLRLVISIMILEVGVFLRSIVPSELKDTFSLGSRIDTIG